MLSKIIEKALNEQVHTEAYSSHFYLAMAVWAETQGYPGIAQFLYTHSDEERMHMLKLVKFINERGGKAIIPMLDKPKVDYSDVQNVFTDLLKHEQKVTSRIHEVVDACLKEKDYTTHNFMQWYVSEQIEEEALARTIQDKIALIGNDKSGWYLFDRDINTLKSQVQKDKTA
jgi:ferritin